MSEAAVVVDLLKQGVPARVSGGDAKSRKKKAGGAGEPAVDTKKSKKK